MNNKKPQGDLSHIGGILPGLLKTCRRQPEGALTQIWDLWESIVGEMLAENARPAAIKGRLILVHVESPAWVHHLQFLKPGLIKKINDALGKPLVDDIRFKVGPL